MVIYMRKISSVEISEAIAGLGERSQLLFTGDVLKAIEKVPGKKSQLWAGEGYYSKSS